MENLVGGYHAFRFVIVPASGIKVSLETREVAAADLNAYPVPLLEIVAG